MDWINWIPEIILMTLLMSYLLLINLKKQIFNLFKIAILLIVAILTVLFIIKSEANVITLTFKSIIFDQAARYGRIVSLFLLILGSMQIWLNESFPYLKRIKFLCLFLFFIIFIDLLALSNTPLMFGMSWIGALIALTSMLKIEGRLLETKASVMRLSGVLAVIYATSFMFLTLYPNSDEIIIWVGFLVSLGFPLGGLWIRASLSNSPIVQSFASVWIWMGGAFFWIRFGQHITTHSPEALGVLFSVSSLHAAWAAFRTKNHSIWLGSCLLSMIQLSWMCLLLIESRMTSLFYLFGISLVVVSSYAGYAFRFSYQNQNLAKIISALSLAGLPPFITAAIYYNLIQELSNSGYLLFAGAITLSWFLIIFSVIQLTARLLINNRDEKRVVISARSKMILVLFLTTIIGLVWFQDPLFVLLSNHS